MKGRILPEQIHRERANKSSIFKKEAFGDRMESVWSYNDWADTIFNYVRYLEPMPRHIVMNAGIWPHKFCASSHSNRTSLLSNDNYATSLSNETLNLLRVMNRVPEFRFIWRTTTVGKDGVRPEFECDDVMCELLPTCVNVSFSISRIQSALYVDQNHFFEPVYRMLNEVMLNDLGYLPKQYVRLNLSVIMMP
jgi:hypothetical protein